MLEDVFEGLIWGTQRAMVLNPRAPSLIGEHFWPFILLTWFARCCRGLVWRLARLYEYCVVCLETSLVWTGRLWAYYFLLCGVVIWVPLATCNSAQCSAYSFLARPILLDGFYDQFRLSGSNTNDFSSIIDCRRSLLSRTSTSLCALCFLVKWPKPVSWSSATWMAPLSSSAYSPL